MEITDEILETIVNEQKISGLGLVTSDGRPHCTPVWVHYHDGNLFIFSRSGRAKERYIRKNPECMIAFDFASLRGTIEIIEKGTESYDEIYNIADQRYGDSKQLETYKENWDIAFKITPTKLYR